MEYRSMCAVPILILILIYRAATVDPCYNKPCSCCSTQNCSPINNTCENGCIDGFTGDNCYTSCPVNCVNCWQIEREICDTCKDGYHNGYWHDEETRGHWSENCSHKCRPQCKKCFRYRTCLECVDGFYINSTYQDCQLRCPEKCVSCLSESDCTLCKPGFYGKDCSQYCGKGCNSPACEKKTGFCNCTENYSGARCQFCKLGRYGIDCDLKCPENCMYCNQSGMCLLCRKGLSGLHCRDVLNITSSTAQTTVTRSPKEFRNSGTVYIVLGTIFAILLISLVVLILYWRIRKNRAKIDAVLSAKMQAMNGECETDVACNVDTEMEVYDEIPYNWTKPKTDATYLNHELDKLDADESPDDDVLKTNERCIANDTLAENMSITCMKTGEKKQRKASSENRTRHNFELEPQEGKTFIASRQSSFTADVGNTFETQTSFISGVRLESADDYEELQTEETMEKPENFAKRDMKLSERELPERDMKLPERDMKLPEKSMMNSKERTEFSKYDKDERHSGEVGRQRNDQNHKFKYLTAKDESGYENRHGNDISKTGKTSRAENDYETFEDKLGRGKGTRDPKTGQTANLDIDSDQLQKERYIQRNRAEFDSKEITKRIDSKLKYLTGRYGDDNDNQRETKLRAENDYQKLEEKFRKGKETRELRTGRGDNLDIDNGQLQKERYIQENRENFEFVGQKGRKNHNKLKLKYLTRDEDDNDLQDRKGKHEKEFVAENNYEKLEEKLGKERTIDGPKKGKDSVRYYDSRPLEDDVDSTKCRMDSTSEHDYERLGREIDQTRTSSIDAKKGCKPSDNDGMPGNRPFGNKMNEGKMFPGEDYEHSRTKYKTESSDSDQSSDIDYYNLTYV